ncbi:MAG: hypothetical protein K2P78_14980 [Gemmataceae bacterium]|nr:hypothetical protein [Gemmataceae bacterium]
MNTTEVRPADELSAELREALADLAAGARDRDRMKAACERMDRAREETRARFGEQQVAVDLIREARDRR